MHSWFPLVRAGDPAAAPALAALGARLTAFYADNEAYFDCAATTVKDRIYRAFRPLIDGLLRDRARISVLEFGCGRTLFAEWLEREGLRERVHFTAQDITEANRDFLAGRCDAFLSGDVADGIAAESYDLIFSTFVYEHLLHPDAAARAALAGLRPGGFLVVVSPRYDRPGHIPPALRHLPWPARTLANLRLVASALAVRVRGRPNFWVVTEPAVLDRGFVRDADAVHMVSPADLDLAMRGQADRVPLKVAAVSFLDGLFIHLLWFAVAYRKR